MINALNLDIKIRSKAQG